MAIALEIYEALKSIGVEEGKAKSTAEKFEEALNGKLERELKSLATREDMVKQEGSINADMAKLEGSLHEVMAKMEASLRKDMAKIREDMALMETRIIKWNVGTIIAVAGLTLAIVKLVG